MTQVSFPRAFTGTIAVEFVLEVLESKSDSYVRIFGRE
jgi:hypothetical protein